MNSIWIDSGEVPDARKCAIMNTESMKILLLQLYAFYVEIQDVEILNIYKEFINNNKLLYLLSDF